MCGFGLSAREIEKVPIQPPFLGHDPFPNVYNSKYEAKDIRKGGEKDSTAKNSNRETVKTNYMGKDRAKRSAAASYWIRQVR